MLPPEPVLSLPRTASDGAKKARPRGKGFRKGSTEVADCIASIPTCQQIRVLRLPQLNSFPNESKPNWCEERTNRNEIFVGRFMFDFSIFAVKVLFYFRQIWKTCISRNFDDAYPQLADSLSNLPQYGEGTSSEALASHYLFSEDYEIFSNQPFSMSVSS